MARGQTRRAQAVVAVCAAALAVLGTAALAGPLGARSAVSKTEAYVGESITLTIEVRGSRAVKPPDLSALGGQFTVRSLGGTDTSSSVTTIVNGRVSRQVNEGYVFRYRLTPLRPGVLTIPSLTMDAGQPVTTRPIRIRVQEPEETGDFKLRLALPKETCYVGEPLTLKLTWYVSKSVEGFEINMPLASDPRFMVQLIEEQVTAANRQNLVEAPLNGQRVIARKSTGEMDGKEYLTLSLRWVVLPLRPGRIELPGATVAFSAVVGHKYASTYNFFGDPVRRKVAVRKSLVVPSNRPALDVQEPPIDGRPPGFSGLVGQYQVGASATPTQVNVGDPITLTVRVSGPDYLDNVELPPLQSNADMARDFRVPKDMASPKIEAGAKVWTQTVRANHAKVTAIPPIDLPYFDAGKGEYAVARSEAIPLEVRPTKVVTARDAEGTASAAPVRSRLKAWTQGIAHNYEDLSVLDDQSAGPLAWIRSPLWMALLGAPPGLYLVLLAATVTVRRRRADPAAIEARRAQGVLRRELAGCRDPAALLDAVKGYLGRKLRTASGAITFADTSASLVARGVAPEKVAELRDLFEACEAHRYAGGASSPQDAGELARRARDLLGRIERDLR